MNLRITASENFYVFHFSYAYEDPYEIVIYGCINKDLDMENIMNFKRGIQQKREQLYKRNQNEQADQEYANN